MRGNPISDLTVAPRAITLVIWGTGTKNSCRHRETAHSPEGRDWVVSRPHRVSLDDTSPRLSLIQPVFRHTRTRISSVPPS